jgi:hypothetical protein
MLYLNDPKEEGLHWSREFGLGENYLRIGCSVIAFGHQDSKGTTLHYLVLYLE